MGDAADAILDGACCQVCGEYFMDEEDTGYPRTCAGCDDGDDQDDEDVDMARVARSKKQKTPEQHLQSIIDSTLGKIEVAHNKLYQAPIDKKYRQETRRKLHAAIAAYLLPPDGSEAA